MSATRLYVFFYTEDEDDHDWLEVEATSESDAWSKAYSLLHPFARHAHSTLWLRDVREVVVGSLREPAVVS